MKPTMMSMTKMRSTKRSIAEKGIYSDITFAWSKAIVKGVHTAFQIAKLMTRYSK